MVLSTEGEILLLLQTKVWFWDVIFMMKSVICLKK